MKDKIFPNKFIAGDNIRVVAPSRSASILSTENYDFAQNHMNREFGTKITFGKNHQEKDIFNSSSVDSRLSDIHEAFSDPSIKIISTAIGGFNSNQLLKYIDWDLIRNNPKIFCGYSDVTVLANAIYAKTGLVTYSGPHFSTFAQEKYLEYTVGYFKKCLFESGEYNILPSMEWLDDHWYKDQKNRTPIKNDGYWVLQRGVAEGTIIGGNLSSLILLFGTEYMPDLTNSIIFVEVDNYTQGIDILEFDRQLQTLLLQKGGDEIKAVIIGRFQNGSEVSREHLQYVIDTKKELKNIPIIANVDFGHTNPMITFPIGGNCRLSFVDDKNFEIKITQH